MNSVKQENAGLDAKVLEFFGDRRAVVHKGLAHFSEGFRKLPRFVADFLIASLVDPASPAEGIAKIEKLMEERYFDTTQKELVKSRIRDQGRYSLFGQMRVRYDQGRDTYWAEVPALGDMNVRIDKSVIRESGEFLLTTGAWGTLDIAFDGSFRQRQQQYPFFITKFQPMQITQIDVGEWIEKRHHFTAAEWTDLLITSIGFNPSRLDEKSKLLYLARLIPFVEPSVNMIELGPPESGKTYTYRAMSAYSFVVSGSNTSVASLFYNKLRRRMGLIGHRDCIMFDEITKANLASKEMAPVISMLMDFMNNGRFGRDAEEFGSECGIVFVGNIDTDRPKRQPAGFYPHLFSVMPELIREDRAFFDRMHGFIPGWVAPQISPANYANSYGWMADYLSEVMHRMRARNYTHIVFQKVDFNGMGQRNQVAISRMASGMLKLVFPHRTVKTIQPQEVKWAVEIAIELRQRVLDQLAVIAPGEFGGTKLTYTMK